MAENVSGDACNRTHQAVEKELANMDKRLNSHSTDIVDLKELLVRVTTLQEIAMANQEKQNETLEKIDNRVLDRASEREQRKQTKFWQSTLGEWVIKGSFILGGIILLTALGQTINIDSIMKFFGK